MLKKRLLWTAVIVLAVVGAVTGHIDRASEKQAEDALKNALVTFAVARTLNGVISAAQGTEVALEPGGVGVVLSVGGTQLYPKSAVISSSPATTVTGVWLSSVASGSPVWSMPAGGTTATV